MDALADELARMVEKLTHPPAQPVVDTPAVKRPAVANTADDLLPVFFDPPSPPPPSPPPPAPTRPPRRQGPMTAASAVIVRPHSRVARASAYAWPVVAVLSLIPSAIRHQLLNYADGVLGFDALLCLIACLMVTPIITVARAKITKLRWWYGIWVFGLGAAGLAIHLAFPPGGMQQRVSGNAVEWTGLLIVVLLIPMVLTANMTAQKLLGPEWKRWQRNLIWAVWVVVAIHLLVMHAWVILVAYYACTLPAIAVRNARVRRAVKAWRSGGYSTGGWWFTLALLSTLAVAGLSVLAVEEIRAIVLAFTLR